ncbi:MqnA/MqnD/SBP family protein [Thermoplasma volcanium]|nr:menaquinone biosynthesis family protein [Thermoplasma volcanium]
MRIMVAHTPDPDDAFMFYGMFEGKIRTSNQYEQVIKDIETLNKESKEGKYEVTAISANGYVQVRDLYKLTRSGASFGISYGPIVVARNEIDLSKSRMGVPGFMTSSYLLYRMFGPEAKEYVEIKFDEIPDAILTGKVDAGILIHDEQLTFQKRGLKEVFDIYSAWKSYAGNLPIPLGFNAIRKDLDEDTVNKFLYDFERSIRYAMAHEEEAVKYAMKYARYTDLDLERRFVRMYVNELSIDFGDTGRKALELYYNRAAGKGLIPPFKPEIV